MSPQAIRMSSGRPDGPRRPPARTVLLLLGAALVAFLLGRLALPLAVLLVLALTASLWFGPEVAYWLDDELRLHRVPGFGDDHRQMALASFAYLMVAAVLGSLLLGLPAQLAGGGSTAVLATPSAVPPSPEPLAAAPTATTLPTPTAAPPPTPTVGPPAEESQPADVPAPTAAAPPGQPKPAPPPPRPIATPPPPTPTVVIASVSPAAVASPALSKPSAPAANQPPVATAAGPNGQVKPESTLPPLGATSGLVAEIAGVTTVARPGGRAILQARATPGAQCELSVRYPDGSGGPTGAQQAGDDGLCTLSWSVPAQAPSGWGTATLVVRQGERVETRRVNFTVAR